MGIVSSQFNWVSTPTAYSQVTNWRAKQKAFNSNVAANLAAVSYTFADTATTLGTGMGEIAAKRAAVRVQAELQAKIAKTQLDMSA
ncbi:hypothetical protein PQJ75_05220 [Rhodoplanes sp. TEM]|uniref:Uncharacterized protein n=1 Tax=Rhodoplanes tepidamans TaxID=200616 RepID=A0ABT5JA87_RHOTP|nr:MULTISPECIES: hypothetical protein [Rhodoplanes]MDC7786539.1 hypothetical protein [Rhodoplanes tepidamans]MDC7983123.1 hypothetical protein [Rhodoplanes sp. TEM]MDQ0357581.1 hypothetical protein [Rhodoplanes tepidamans]